MARNEHRETDPPERGTDTGRHDLRSREQQRPLKDQGDKLEETDEGRDRLERD